MTARSLTRGLLACACVALSLAASGANAGDLYDTAVANSARPANDVKRDALDHPAELLRLAGIKPGMRVADLLAADGYYSELLSYIVGPKGQVLMINNEPFDRWSAKGMQKRLDGNRLPNVEHRTVDLANMQLGDGTLDAVLLVKVYHDLYWVDKDTTNWPKIDVPKVLDQVAKALKPGGVLLVVDHSAKAGSGSAAASPLHRIEESFAKKDFESHGFRLVSQSDALRRPDDQRDLLSYEGPGAGKTDRFVLVFRKPG